MTDPVAEAWRRVQRAWSADGLSEITAGLLFFLPAVMEWAKAGLDQHDSAWRVLNLTQLLVILPGVSLAIWLLPRVRNRLFGHREGVMIPQAPPQRRAKAVMAALVAFSIAALLVIIVTQNPHWAALTLLVAGFGSAGILCQIGWSSGIRRFLVLGGFIVLASIAIAAQRMDFETSFVWQFGSMGLLLMAAGVVSLVKFLRMPPRRQEIAG